MTKFMCIAISAVFSYLLIAHAIATGQAQTCGKGFVAINILDADGKSIPNVTIELIAEIPEKEAEEIYRNAPVKIMGGWGTAVMVSTQAAKDIIKRGTPMSRNKDFCEEPLKHRIDAPEMTMDNMRKPGKFVFSFCTAENWGQRFLLKISAPGYLSSYYVGPFLNGCGSIYNFVLCKKD